MNKLPYDVARERGVKAFQDGRMEATIWEGSKDTIHIDFMYPRLGGKIKFLELGLSDVRASDGIRITYDFDRDGYVIFQRYIVEVDKGTYIDDQEIWKEVGFFQSWALEGENVTLEPEGTA